MNPSNAPGRPHWGRILGISGVIVLVSFPTAWLAGSVILSGVNGAFREILHGPFLAAVGRSVIQGFWLMLWSLVIGWPCGILGGLMNSRLSRVIQGLLVIPLLMPTFLWAIGISNLRTLLSYRLQSWLDGLSGCVLALAVLTVPLIILTTIRSVESLGSSQLDSARLSGGDQTLWRLTARYSFPAAFCAAIFGALITLADPGPAQIMGFHGAASEILIAFAARHDVGLAVVKSVGLSAMLAPLIATTAWMCAGQMESDLDGRVIRQVPSVPWSPGQWFAAISLMAVVLVLVALPLIGLVMPLSAVATAGKSVSRAVSALTQSVGVTVWYGLTAGLVATALGLSLALLAGRSRTYRRTVLMFSFLFLSVTPSLLGLGLVLLSARCPPDWDLFIRSGWIVGLGLGLRFVPVGTILCVNALSKIPRSIEHAAAVHGLSRVTYHCRILLPLLLPTLVTSIVVIALLSLADVSATMLLAPPGEATYPGRIFAMMDNASAQLVAAFCLVYLITACLPVLLLLGLGLLRNRGENARC